MSCMDVRDSLGMSGASFLMRCVGCCWWLLTSSSLPGCETVKVPPTRERENLKNHLDGPDGLRLPCPGLRC